jgi:hypothetical protein
MKMVVATVFAVVLTSVCIAQENRNPNVRKPEEEKTEPSTQPREQSSFVIVGQMADIIVVRTADGGYRCLKKSELPLTPEQAAQIPDATPIYHAHQICQRLGESPSDLELLQMLGKAVSGIADTNAFCHYAAIYYIDCLRLRNIDLAAEARRAIVKKDRNNRYLSLFTAKNLTAQCSACKGVGKEPHNSSNEKCRRCDGTGREIMAWKVERIWKELALDGEMNWELVQMQVNRVNPPLPFDGMTAQPDLEPATEGALSADAETTKQQLIVSPERVKTDPKLWGKWIIVEGKVTQTVRQLGGFWFVILEGFLRCQLKKGIAVDSSLQNKTVSVKGLVVLRPDKSITANAHMVECEILAP